MSAAPVYLEGDQLSVVIVTAEGTKDAVAVAVPHRLSVRRSRDFVYNVKVYVRWSDSDEGTNSEVGQISFRVMPADRSFYLDLWEFGYNEASYLREFKPYLKGTALIFLRDAILRCMRADLLDANSKIKLTALPLQMSRGLSTKEEWFNSNRRLTDYYKRLGFEFTYSGTIEEQFERSLFQRPRTYNMGVPMHTTVSQFLSIFERTKQFRTTGASVWRAVGAKAAELLPNAPPHIKQERIDRAARYEMARRHLYSNLRDYVRWERTHPDMPQTTEHLLPEDEHIRRLYQRISAGQGDRTVRWATEFTDPDSEPPIEYNDDVPEWFERLEDQLSSNSPQIVTVEPESDDDSFVPAPFEDAPGRVIATIPPSRFRVDDDNESSSGEEVWVDLDKSPLPPLTKKRPFVDLTADSDDDVDDKKVKWTE